MSTSSAKATGVKRKILACALCRKRKVRCDATEWPCKNCQKAGAECLGSISGDDNEHSAPRSLVLWLQNEIAALETVTEIEPSIQTTSGPRPSPPRQPTSLRDAVSQDLRTPWLGLSEQVSLPKFVLLSEPRLPSTESVEVTDPDQHSIATIRTANNPPRTDQRAKDPLKSIPKQITNFLLEIYISRVMSSYPIYLESSLRQSHQRVFPPSDARDITSPTLNDIYTVSLVMAVALSTAARARQTRANSMAFALFQHAVPLLKNILSGDTFVALQALILLHTYAIMNPAAANVYFLAGFTMQACIDLGLHVEPETYPEALSRSDVLSRDLRRRVFWTAWELDASCSSGFGRRVALLPSQITTGFPAELEDASIGTDQTNALGRPSKFLCARIRTFRLIEAEAILVLFHDHPIATDTSSRGAGDLLNEWLHSIEDRIHTWRAAIHLESLSNTDTTLTTQWEEMTVFADIADPLIIVTAFRPSPRIKHPTTANLLKAFEASLAVVKGYLRQASMSHGSPKYTFQPCHHVFTSAMVFLHTIRECPAALASRYTVREMEDHMAAFTDFFTITGERWPAARRCLNEYHRILSPLRERFVNHDCWRPWGNLESTGFQVPEQDTHVMEPSELDYWPNFYDIFSESEDILNLPIPPEDSPASITGDQWMAASSLDWERHFDFGT